MESIEVESSGAEWKIPGQLTIQISILWTSTSGLQEKTRVYMKTPDAIARRR
ncbi:Hypothetical protein FKW44_023077 [Caligus rogercresseyi]|uniref:Uncharacterized protein n=1 Tax=Caligus rogercresseyi TaxID=217165 RepID=A0A7T8JTZ9_CALRO|nr:Hypothetical protein FKW44_023077 [Caligus rogercresseyi]